MIKLLNQYVIPFGFTKGKIENFSSELYHFFYIILLNTTFRKEEKKDLLLLWTMVGGRVNNL